MRGIAHLHEPVLLRIGVRIALGTRLDLTHLLLARLQETLGDLQDGTHFRGRRVTATEVDVAVVQDPLEVGGKLLCRSVLVTMDLLLDVVQGERVLDHPVKVIVVGRVEGVDCFSALEDNYYFINLTGEGCGSIWCHWWWY